MIASCNLVLERADHLARGACVRRRCSTHEQCAARWLDFQPSRTCERWQGRRKQRQKPAKFRRWGQCTGLGNAFAWLDPRRQPDIKRCRPALLLWL